MTKKTPVLNTYIILDRSGSMARDWVETLGSVNGYVAELKKAEASANITVVAFDTVNPFEIVRDNVSLTKWVDIHAEEISPRGGTPLYDATVKTIIRALNANNEKTIFVVMTDGEENSSQEFNQATAKQLIQFVTKNGWEVMFLGANFDAKTYTDAMGLGVGKFVNTTTAMRGATMSNLAGKAMAYTAAFDVQAAGAAMNFTPQEQKISEEK